ncbi:phosphatidylglycerophosphatase A family protein [Candidatus Williamhamiltonella defendens]|uniref:phosphatidylglycerophosphatase A family protein n=1 Tax=Candidatus Williamhamiltonella defendens TaxID=138072 RepID=UPI0016515F45|nr:phosphatidylglycerophosphatase A [Candidatus Hamiltonella defensa]
MSNPIHLLATGFGSGLSSLSPGTMGSLAAIPFWFVLIALPNPFYIICLILSCGFGIYLCGRTAQEIGVDDPSCIVWDEFVGLWITLSLLPKEAQTPLWITVGFLLFRLFDIWKPFPICVIDRHIRGGVGIMLDDVIAGFFAAMMLFLFHRIL